MLPAEVKGILDSANLCSFKESTSSSLVKSDKQVTDLIALESKVQMDYFILKQRLSAFMKV